MVSPRSDDPRQSASLIPPAKLAQVWIDFDGTITQKDVLDELITRFAVDDSWKQAEREWQAGKIGSADCLRRQFAVVRISDEQLGPFVDSIPIDPGIVSLLSLVKKLNVPIAVLSDGIDRFIKPILARSGISDLMIRSNSIDRDGLKVNLVCPHGRADCVSKSAHCKCGSIDLLGQTEKQSIYIGDGRSDLCPSRKSECVFAKGVLGKFLEEEGMPFIPFDTLSEVHGILSTAWGLAPSL